MKLKNFDRKTINEVFDEFLKEEEVYYEYYDYRADTEKFDHELDNFSVMDYITRAFDWEEESGEGYYFWEGINDRWVDKLEEEHKSKTKIIDLI